jgi:flagellar P-ring protein precursor FlgI
MLALVVVSMLAAAGSARAERIKDLASVQGVRTNQLYGYGLIIGLDGSGDQTTQAPFTSQSLLTMLQQLGITLPAGVNPQLKNVAAVMVTAQLPAFVQPGQNIDVTVSSIGNAKSLRGGTLLATALKGLDGRIYAIAQGNLVVGGLGIDGADGSRVSINIPTAGRIASGATVELEVPATVGGADVLTLNLNTADFTTASRLAEVVNQSLGAGTAQPLDPTSVQVRAPATQAERVGFVSVIENLEVAPGEAPARVIVNSRTGTVVISSRVQVLPAAVAHGSLAVSITEDFDVSQPQPFSRTGETVVTPQTRIDINQGDNRMFLFKAGVDLNEIVQAVNQVGAAPGDLVAILEALRSAGALRAQLIVI